MKNPETKAALIDSLLSLSKSNTVHYEVTAAEIAATRYAILKMDGVEIDAELAAQHADLTKRKRELEKEVASLVERKNRLLERIEELENAEK